MAGRGLAVTGLAPRGCNPHTDSGHALFITAGRWGLVFSARLMSAAEILQYDSIIKSLFIKKKKKNSYVRSRKFTVIIYNPNNSSVAASFACVIQLFNFLNIFAY